MSEQYLLLNLGNSSKKIIPPDSLLALIQSVKILRHSNEENDISLTFFKEKEGIKNIIDEEDYQQFLNYWFKCKHQAPSLNVEEQYKMKRKGSVNVNAEFENEDFDTNPKSKKDLYSKTSYNKSNLRRIYYIKEKKEMNKVEQEKKMKDFDVEKDEAVKIKKQKRKNVYKNVEVDQN